MTRRGLLGALEIIQAAAFLAFALGLLLMKLTADLAFAPTQPHQMNDVGVIQAIERMGNDD
jgi:hypothetical protein